MALFYVIISLHCWFFPKIKASPPKGQKSGGNGFSSIYVLLEFLDCHKYFHLIFFYLKKISFGGNFQIELFLLMKLNYLHAFVKWKISNFRFSHAWNILCMMVVELPNYLHSIQTFVKKVLFRSFQQHKTCWKWKM